MKIEITDFAKRQFDRNANGTKIDVPVELFEERVNIDSNIIQKMIDNMDTENETIRINNQVLLNDKINEYIDTVDISEITIGPEDVGYLERVTFKEVIGLRVMEGYAPFCKLVAIDNFTKARVGTMKITNENYQYLRSGYSGRRDSELPVLSRWFELPLSAPRAKYLILVLYSREQLEKEHNAQPETAGTPFEMEGEWGVVSILGQRYNKEEPMTPITAMRNALPIEEGGSGKELDKEYYKRSVGFWSNNAVVKSR